MKDGRLAHRKLAASYYPSINAASVRTYAAERETERQWREQRRSEQAAVLGISRSRLWPRARAGRTPFTWKDDRMWFRRSDIETRAAVLAFQVRRDLLNEVSEGSRSSAD